LLVLLSHSASLAQLTLSPATAAQMVGNLLGPGVTATNITFTGAPAARATFTCSGGCSLGFPGGIMLSTGSASGTTSPASYFASTSHNLGGDPQLDAIVPSGLPTRDAAILEFDFSVASDSVKFEFIFGSEEYNDYVNTNFNDVFAFFISGPGIVGSQNMAVIPTTSTGTNIVSINNVNNGGPYPSTASGPCTNCQYYVDNVNGTGFFLDGHTVPLMAKARVRPCETYHMKIAIADVSDWVFDSAVFLKAQSFSSLGQISITANGVGYNSNATVYACQGDSVLLSLSPANNYNWNTGATTQSIWVTQPAGSNTGNYSAFTFMSPNCFAFTTNINVIWTAPTASITPSGSLSLCPGGNVTLTANQGQSYLWSNGATSQSITVSSAGTYSVTVSNGPNCSATSTPVNVTVGGATASINGVLSLCNGANTTLTATPGTAYLWSNGATTQSINVTTAGNYTVTVTANGGCSATATANVLVNANPSPTITGTFSACQGNATTLNAPAGFSSYLWSNGATTASINPTTAGTYTVTVTGTGGCTGTTSQAVTINANPTPAISGTFAVCQGTSATLNAPVGQASYLWSNGATTPTITPTVAGTYTVTVTSASGCTGSASQAVTVNANPVPTISGTFSVCQGSAAALTAAPAGAASYLWSNGATSATINPVAAGNYTVTVTLAGGCSGTSSQSVTINPNPAPAISGTFAVCSGSAATLNGPAGFTSYAWSNGASTSSISPTVAGNYTLTVTNSNGCTGTTSQAVTLFTNPSPTIAGTFTVCQGTAATLNATPGLSTYVWSNGASTANINPTTSGTYTVTVTNANGCTGTVSQAVVVNPNPVPFITGTFTVCSGNAATLNGPLGVTTYAWSNGANTQTINPTTAGTYTLTVTNANGCIGTTSQAVIVNANPAPAISGNFVACQGNTTTLNATAGLSSYSWSNGATTATINPSTAGTYTVTVTNASGCTGSTSQLVTINPNPAPTITGTFTVCQGSTASFNATPGLSGYLWSNGATSANINPAATGTYTVTVTDINGCTGVTSQAAIINANPTPVISGTFAVCAGNAATLNGPVGMTNYTWSNGATSSSINPTTAGIYSLTVTDGNGCIGSTNQLVTINANPVPTIAGTFIACQGSVTTLNATAGLTSYNWSNGASTATINPTTAGTYTVTVTDANGCTGTVSQAITINPNPVPSISGTFAVCQGFSATLNATPGLVSYAWSNGATGAAISPSTSATYTVTVTDVNGCTGSTSQLVTINPNPTPIISGTFDVCAGNAATLNGPAGMSVYSWSNGASSSSINPSTGGTYSLTVTDGNGCIGSTSQLVTINANPVPAITGTFIACQGNATTLSATSGLASYSWSNGSSTATINPTAAGTYTVTVTDANGCTGTVSQLVTINANPVPVITGTFAACQGFNATLNASPGFVTYQWNNGNSSAAINPNSSGNYTITVTDANGCTGVASQLVTINANPVPTITGSNAICDGTTATWDAGNYASYSWSNGATTQTITSGVAGTYAVTVTDLNGCIGSTSQTLTVYALPTAIITGDNTICFGENSNLNVVLTGTAPFTYVWTNGATNSAPITSNTNTSSFNVTPNTTSVYTLVSVSDSNCPGNLSGSATITVNPLPIPVVNGDLSICDGETSTLTATPGYVNYTWSNNSNATSITTGTGGSYTVTVTDLNGCVGTSAPANLVVNMVPVVSFIADTVITCKEQKGVFTNTSVYDPGSTFAWTFGDGGTSAATNPSHLYLNQGTYPISLTITTPAGCVSSANGSIEIVYFPLPVADFVTSPEINGVFNGKVEFVDRSDFAVSWIWDFGDGNFSATQNPEHYFNEVGEFNVRLTVSNLAGCEDTHSEVITIIPYYLPNAFTPNGDGINDNFFFAGYDLDVTSYEMKIFDRWGNLMFLGENNLDVWKGNSPSGDEAPQGTYAYRIIVKTRGGKEHIFNGAVTLVR